MEPPGKKSRKENRKDRSKDKTKLVENILTYDVLRIIFKHLTAKELASAAHLCRVWRDAANEELASRRTPECYYKCYNTMLQTGSDAEYPNVLGNQLKIKPAFAFICPKLQTEDEWRAAGCYCSNLPKTCNTIQMGGYDVVDNKLRSSDSRLGVAASAYLPQMSGLSHKVYHIHKFCFKTATDVDIQTHAEDTVNKLLPPDDEKRCIILLANQQGYKYNKLVLKGIQKAYKPGSISLWGGICVDLKLCEIQDFHRCSQYIHWTGMYISSPSMESYSLVIPQSCRLEPQMTEKLEKLRKSIKLKKHSLGFMFACIERVKRKNREIKVFNKVFPEVPLIGLHGDGEYGLNTLNTKRESELHHSYSTVFLILTYA